MRKENLKISWDNKCQLKILSKSLNLTLDESIRFLIQFYNLYKKPKDI